MTQHFDIALANDQSIDPAVRLRMVFNDLGNFPGLDPYRKYDPIPADADVTPERRAIVEKLIAIHDLLFNESGSVRDWVYNLLPELINENHWSWDCDAVRLIYAQEHGRNTSSSYPATHMWK